jgi:hypothetical protein
MTKRNWLLAACATGLLAGGPVLAQQTQTSPQPGGATTQAPTGGPTQQSPTAGATNGSMNQPAGTQANTGSANTESANPSPMHANSRPMHTARRGRTDTSQNAEVDRLNDESYQAAQQGKAFNFGSSGGSSTSPSTSNPSGKSAPSGTSPSGGSRM